MEWQTLLELNGMGAIHEASERIRSRPVPVVEAPKRTNVGLSAKRTPEQRKADAARARNNYYAKRAQRLDADAPRERKKDGRFR